MLMTLNKGHVINFIWSENVHIAAPSGSEVAGCTDKDWVKGSILLIIATLSWAAFFILQAVTLKRYAAHLSLTSIVCFLGTLQSIAVTFVMEHKASVWQIGWDINLLAAAYAGIVSSSIADYVRGLVMKKRGPVFVTAFSPLMMIIVAIMGSFILAEKIYVGGVLGGVIIVAGLYAVLWGKYKEYKEEEAETISEPIKANEEYGHNATMIKDFEANDIEMQRNQDNKVPALAVTAPNSQAIVIANQAEKD